MPQAIDQNNKVVPSVRDFSVPDQVSLSGSTAITPPANTVEIHLICDTDFYINHTTPAASTDFKVPADTLYVLPLHGVGGDKWDGSSVSFYVYGASGTLSILYLKK